MKTLLFLLVVLTIPKVNAESLFCRAAVKGIVNDSNKPEDRRYFQLAPIEIPLVDTNESGLGLWGRAGDDVTTPLKYSYVINVYEQDRMSIMIQPENQGRAISSFGYRHQISSTAMDISGTYKDVKLQHISFYCDLNKKKLDDLIESFGW